jgi:CRP-like cAMP-binding protein
LQLAARSLRSQKTPGDQLDEIRSGPPCAQPFAFLCESLRSPRLHLKARGGTLAKLATDFFRTISKLSLAEMKSYRFEISKTFSLTGVWRSNKSKFNYLAGDRTLSLMTIETFIKQYLSGYQDGDVTLPFDVDQAELNANSIVTRYGQIEDKLFLLSEGIIQVSTLKGEEEERILEFVFPGDFFCAYTSFLLQQPSDVEVTTLSKCRVSSIKREALLQANQRSLISNQLSLHIAQQLFLSRARREKDFLTLSAEERYRALFEKDPDELKHIPVHKIAKYLGIHPESLSRIRKAIIS